MAADIPTWQAWTVPRRPTIRPGGMRLLRRDDNETTPAWRQCLECGDRYRTKGASTFSNFCSIKCESAALRRQRDQVETTWIRATWFLR